MAEHDVDLLPVLKVNPPASVPEMDGGVTGAVTVGLLEYAVYSPVRASCPEIAIR